MVELAVRKGRITEEKAGAFLESLADLSIEIENPTRPLMFTSVRVLASRYELISYEPAYLELATRHDLPIAALDNALTQAVGRQHQSSGWPAQCTVLVRLCLTLCDRTTIARARFQARG